MLAEAAVGGREVASESRTLADPVAAAAVGTAKEPWFTVLVARADRAGIAIGGVRPTAAIESRDVGAASSCVRFRWSTDPALPVAIPDGLAVSVTPDVGVCVGARARVGVNIAQAQSAFGRACSRAEEVGDCLTSDRLPLRKPWSSVGLQIDRGKRREGIG